VGGRGQREKLDLVRLGRKKRSKRGRKGGGGMRSVEVKDLWEQGSGREGGEKSKYRGLLRSWMIREEGETKLLQYESGEKEPIVRLEGR